jgi:hypothetical protein
MAEGYQFDCVHQWQSALLPRWRQFGKMALCLADHHELAAAQPRGSPAEHKAATMNVTDIFFSRLVQE